MIAYPGLAARISDFPEIRDFCGTDHAMPFAQHTILRIWKANAIYADMCLLRPQLHGASKY